MTFLHKVQYVFHTQVMKIALQEVCWYGSKALASKMGKRGPGTKRTNTGKAYNEFVGLVPFFLKF